MLAPMISAPFPVGFVFTAAFTLAALTCLGEARPNPYVGIVDRNPFGLKPPPPPPVETNQEPATPPPSMHAAAGSLLTCSWKSRGVCLANSPAARHISSRSRSWRRRI